MSHLREVEEIRHSALREALGHFDERTKALENFQHRGERFTANDGKRHEARLMAIEKYIAEHESWGRELVGRYTNQIGQCEKRIDRLEAWQGIRD